MQGKAMPKLYQDKRLTPFVPKMPSEWGAVRVPTAGPSIRGKQTAPICRGQAP